MEKRTGYRIVASDSEIYSDFYDNVLWLRNMHRRDLQDLPLQMLPLANYYLKERLKILHDKPVRIDPRLGRPLPYLAFWFSDALHLTNKQIVNQMALSCLYITVIVSIRDDILDRRAQLSGGKFVSDKACLILANWYYGRYYKIFRNIFPQGSPFWHILSDCFHNWSQYESWRFLFNDGRFNALSLPFLKKSSQYLVEITLPTLAAITILTKNEQKIRFIRRFLTNYCMAFRIADDIRDWRDDIKAERYNLSSVIHHATNSVRISNSDRNDNRVTTRLIERMFLDKKFIRSIYDRLLYFYKLARNELSVFDCAYLIGFMDSQIDFHKNERNFLLNQNKRIRKLVSETLLKSAN